MTRRAHPLFDLNDFSSRLRNESDRACIVLGAALIDAQLERLYLRRLLGNSEDLLRRGAVPRSLSDRIKMAHALGWISDDVLHDLELIRGIRNDFAHSSDFNLSFQDSATATRCEKLWVASVLLDANEHAASVPNRSWSGEVIRAMGASFKPARQRFEVTVEMLAQYLEGLPVAPPAYRGPDLRDELWKLGSVVNFRFEATAKVGRAPDDRAPDSGPN